jgi:hypothetical protein
MRLRATDAAPAGPLRTDGFKEALLAAGERLLASSRGELDTDALCEIESLVDEIKRTGGTPQDELRLRDINLRLERFVEDIESRTPFAPTSLSGGWGIGFSPKRSDVGLVRDTTVRVTDPSGETLRHKVELGHLTTAERSALIEHLSQYDDDQLALVFGHFVEAADALDKAGHPKLKKIGETAVWARPAIEDDLHPGALKTWGMEAVRQLVGGGANGLWIQHDGLSLPVEILVRVAAILVGTAVLSGIIVKTATPFSVPEGTTKKEKALLWVRLLIDGAMAATPWANLASFLFTLGRSLSDSTGGLTHLVQSTRHQKKDLEAETQRLAESLLSLASLNAPT